MTKEERKDKSNMKCVKLQPLAIARTAAEIGPVGVVYAPTSGSIDAYNANKANRERHGKMYTSDPTIGVSYLASAAVYLRTILRLRNNRLRYFATYFKRTPRRRKSRSAGLLDKKGSS